MFYYWIMVMSAQPLNKKCWIVHLSGYIVWYLNYMSIKQLKTGYKNIKYFWTHIKNTTLVNTQLYIIGKDNRIFYILLHFRAKITLYYSIKISKIQCSKNIKKDCNVSKDGRVDSSPETPESRAKIIKTNFWNLENSQTFITTKWTQNRKRQLKPIEKTYGVFISLWPTYFPGWVSGLKESILHSQRGTLVVGLDRGYFLKTP